MLQSRQGGSSTPIWTVLATSVISASSAMLVSSYLRNSEDLDHHQDNDRSEDLTARQCERIRSTKKNTITTFNTVLTRLSAGERYHRLRNSFSKDLPLWLGAGYLILHPRRSSSPSRQSPERFADKLLDFVVIGLLLTYRGREREDSSSSLDQHSSTMDPGSNRRFHNDQGDEAINKELSLQSSNKTAEFAVNSVVQKHDLPLPLPHERTTTSISLDDTTGTEKTSPTTTTTTPTTSMSTTTSEPMRYMELMVYNVSHSDMVLSLDAPVSKDAYEFSTTIPEASLDDRKFCLCRPRFSTFDYFSKKVSQVLPALAKDSLVRFPRYERSDECNRYPIKPEPMAEQHQLPIGFSLPCTDSDDDSLQVTFTELNDLRVRGRDSSRIASYFNKNAQSTTSLNAVFFPLIGTLMPQWQAMIQQKYHTTSTVQQQQHPQQQQPKQVLFLVSGVGSPRNWTHSMTGNSTQVCAELMQHYLQTLYPHLIVVRVHSETNIFRYDENISFVQNELMPCILAYRDAHAKGLPYPDEVMKTKTPSKSGLALINAGRTMDNLPFMDDWKKSFHVTLSFGDGSPARNHAIQAALRTYRPTYYHSWQLKTFWHESKIVDSDIEIHSFEEMETVPALSTKELQDKPLVMQVVDEIKSFSIEMTRVLSGDNQDIQKFWLRKTHKPVLAVLAVQQQNGRIKLYRGTNMEVSMPTGSLCAERNVIGTALADNPGLKRQDLKAIAVLSVPKPPSPKQKGTSSRLARSSSIASYSSLPSLAPDLVTSYSNLPNLGPDFDHGDSSPRLMPSYSTETLPTEGEGSIPILQDMTTEKRPRALSNASGSSALVLRTPPLHPNTNNASGGPPSVPPAITLGPAAAMMVQPPPSPARRIPVYHGGLENTTSNSKRKQKSTSKSRKRHLFVHSGDDMNPLRPCGACNEWLKKIAESNPYFQILTFTDADCNGVYCGFCEE